MKLSEVRRGAAAAAIVLLAGLGGPRAPAHAGEAPSWLRDRGAGVPSSMFGTYIGRGELVVYPYFEYYLNKNGEYAPDELGLAGTEDRRGRYEAYEVLVFLGYGLTDDLVVEFEAAAMDATQRTDPEDPTPGLEPEYHESGIGDVEGQLRWRFMREDGRRPDLFAYFETVFPTRRSGDHLLGTADWEFKLGVGATRGFAWGTLTARAAVEYSAEESKFDLGEYAVEYLRRLSPSWKAYLAVEGSGDELELIPELLWTFRHGRPGMTLVLNSAFGLTSKAQDWAPEVGVQLRF